MRIGETLLSNFQGVDVSSAAATGRCRTQGGWNAGGRRFPVEPVVRRHLDVHASPARPAAQTYSGRRDHHLQRPRRCEQRRRLGSRPGQAVRALPRRRLRGRAHRRRHARDAGGAHQPGERRRARHRAGLRARPRPHPEHAGRQALRHQRRAAHRAVADRRRTLDDGRSNGRSPAGRRRRSTGAIAGRPPTSAPPDANKQYDVRVTRLSGDMRRGPQLRQLLVVSRCARFTTGDPVPVPGGGDDGDAHPRRPGSCRARSTSSTSSRRTIARDWDAATSALGVAADVVSRRRCSATSCSTRRGETPATDSQIDLARLAYWDGVTRPAGRDFNGVFEAKGSLYDALIKIARVGRAMPTLRDLKFSVVIDEPKTAPVRLFTPRNSWDYAWRDDARGDAARLPHRLRQQRPRTGRTEEVVVYDDGYGAGNATRIDRVEWPGIYDRDQAWKEGRFHLAQQRLRRESAQASPSTSSSSSASAATSWRCSMTSSPLASARRGSSRAPMSGTQRSRRHPRYADDDADRQDLRLARPARRQRRAAHRSLPGQHRRRHLAAAVR